MLKISKPSVIKWPVEVMVPREDGGEVKRDFNLHFKPLSDDDLKNVEEQVVAGPKEGAFARNLMACATGWSGLQDENGDDIPFNEQSIQAIMESWLGARFVLAVARAIAEFRHGRIAKN